MNIAGNGAKSFYAANSNHLAENALVLNVRRFGARVRRWDVQGIGDLNGSGFRTRAGTIITWMCRPNQDVAQFYQGETALKRSRHRELSHFEPNLLHVP